MDYSIRIPAIVCRTVHIMCNFNHFIDFALFHDSGTCFFMHFECFSFFSLVIMAKKKVVKEGTPEEIFWDLDALDYAMLKQPYVSRVCRALGIEKKIIHIDDAVDEIMKKLG